MKINKTQENDVIMFALTGRLDTITSPELEAELKKVYEQDRFHLVFALADLEYISSSGLRVLLSAQKKVNAIGTTMKITGCSETIKEIFDVTGFADFMTIE